MNIYRTILPIVFLTSIPIISGADYYSYTDADGVECTPEEVKEIIVGQKENQIRRSTAPSYEQVTEAVSEAKELTGEDEDGCFTILDGGFDVGSVFESMKDKIPSLPNVGGMAEQYSEGLKKSFCSYFDPDNFSRNMKKVARDRVYDYYGGEIRDTRRVLGDYGITNTNRSFAEQVVNRQTRDAKRIIRDSSDWKDPEGRAERNISRDVKDVIINDPLDAAL